MSLSTDQLYAWHTRLNRQLADLETQVSALAARRAHAFRRAVGSDSPTLRRSLARHILLLDRQLERLRSYQALLQRQLDLVGELVYAHEQAEIARLLAEPPPDIPNWGQLFSGEDARRRVDRLLAWLRRLGPPPPPVAGAEVEWATVVHVPDGDGADLEDGRKVRYIGLDAPEMVIHGRREAYAQEARALNEALVVGRRVRLERDHSQTDRYGRLLRYLWVGDRFVNAELVRQGAAYALPIAPDTRYQALFARLEQEARRRKRGLWAGR